MSAPVTPAESDAPLLEVTDLAVEFRTPDGVVRAVDGLSYRVEAGRTLAIVGESGSGKSVSSLAVLGLLPDTARVTRGTVKLDGTDLLSLSRKEHRARCGEQVAMVFQDALAALNPVHTVGYQLTEALRARRGLSRRDARQRAVELLDLVKVPNAKARVSEYPHQFSGGMRQRVMIAMALSMDPDVLIADEPTTALDVTVQAQVLRLLAEIQAERQMGLVLITHDLGVVAGVADDVTVMYAGRAVEQAPVVPVYTAPAHPYTRALLRSIPSAAGTGRLPVIPGRPPSPAAMPSGCPFHPRCDAVRDVCRTDVPPQAVPAPGRMSACHFAADVLAGREPAASGAAVGSASVAAVSGAAASGPTASSSTPGPTAKGDPDD
ncbi:ABC transporter ATP-binding protein [Promicromonospora sukumoe]|uniref:Oligopeptide/dipeptide ABC transporter ATP-binding protein n=1 Tax=Promicromonospora sukumoe TaxID=88382 RepID=A0A7W3JC81_9MICO|nr:ABC transporter ATP-binding protein [Promicromonospora sukumoe]MBA8810124.1 oligopeptide/dipeptide ABC transporter ATP-binding protein [Promicromonospora sukumoe]